MTQRRSSGSFPESKTLKWLKILMFPLRPPPRILPCSVVSSQSNHQPACRLVGTNFPGVKLPGSMQKEIEEKERPTIPGLHSSCSRDLAPQEKTNALKRKISQSNHQPACQPAGTNFPGVKPPGSKQRKIEEKERPTVPGLHSSCSRAPAPQEQTDALKRKRILPPPRIRGPGNSGVGRG